MKGGLYWVQLLVVSEVYQQAFECNDITVIL